jgi:hypothetical protein
MRASSAPPCSSTGEPRNPHNALHGGGENRTRVRSVATTSCWKACVASDSGLPGRRFGKGTTSLALPLNPRFAGPERGANDSLACSPPVRAAGRADQASSRSKVIKGSGARARQPVGVQTMRAGGSSPRLTAVSTGLRPCVRRACRVSSATEPCSSRSIASRETSTRVLTSRPSDPVDRTDQEAQTLLLSGESLVDSLTLHPPPIRSP